jgi:hypothetical protein
VSARRPRPRLSASALAGALVLLASSGLSACDDTRSARLDAGPSATATADPDGAAGVLVERLEQVLTRRDADAATVVAAGARSAREVERMVGNARQLRLVDVTLRYVSESVTGLSRSQRERWGSKAWTVDVQVVWRYGGADTARSTLTVPMALTMVDDEARLVTADLPQAERLPMWLDVGVRVRRAPGVMVVTTASHSATRFLADASVARRTVRRSLPRWQGVLCVHVSPGQAAFRDNAGVPAQQASAIAAVTTTPDGSTAADAPQHVYVNPRLYDPLGEAGRRIVLSHEAAHVALGAASLELPLWLSEGVADYVALVGSATPDERLAAQILQLTRRSGPPATLPGPREFDGSDQHIGAWYEAAWLAVDLMVATYGEEAMWRFYRQSVRDGGTAQAFRDVLGTTQGEFVARWRAHLVYLAG